MNKRIKWGIIILIGAGLAGLGIYQFTPHENEELTAADALPKENKQRTLKVNAQVIKPHLLTDEILVTGRLVPDEEVSLSFETSGKITDIFFTEGTLVKRGELLAKVNDRQLQAQLKRLEAQIPLAEDRVFRQGNEFLRNPVRAFAFQFLSCLRIMGRAGGCVKDAQVVQNFRDTPQQGAGTLLPGGLLQAQGRGQPGNAVHFRFFRLIHALSGACRQAVQKTPAGFGKKRIERQG